MSFEGYIQYLCPSGHLSTFDVYDPDAPEVCPVCGAAFVWHWMVDQTNGYNPEEPSTCPAPLEIRDYEDVWHTDHYGNRYATRRPRYKIPA